VLLLKSIIFVLHYLLNHHPSIYQITTISRNKKWNHYRLHHLAVRMSKMSKGLDGKVFYFFLCICLLDFTLRYTIYCIFHFAHLFSFVVVLLCVFTFWVPCSDGRYDFRINRPVVCRRAHVLFTSFVFVCA